VTSTLTCPASPPDVRKKFLYNFFKAGPAGGLRPPFGPAATRHLTLQPQFGAAASASKITSSAEPTCAYRPDGHGYPPTTRAALAS
jgi:hypothetical protein